MPTFGPCIKTTTVDFFVVGNTMRQQQQNPVSSLVSDLGMQIIEILRSGGATVSEIEARLPSRDTASKVHGECGKLEKAGLLVRNCMGRVDRWWLNYQGFASAIKVLLALSEVMADPDSAIFATFSGALREVAKRRSMLYPEHRRIILGAIAKSPATVSELYRQFNATIPRRTILGALNTFEAAGLATSWMTMRTTTVGKVREAEFSATTLGIEVTGVSPG